MHRRIITAMLVMASFVVAAPTAVAHTGCGDGVDNDGDGVVDELCKGSPSISSAQPDTEQEQNASTTEQSQPSVGGTPPQRIADCESGGEPNPLTARNSSSAAGKWQIKDSTWAGYGGNEYAATADQASESQQDAIAAKIWDNGTGASQWACK